MELSTGKSSVLLLSMFYLVLLTSNASISPEAYWKSVLPSTPMPDAVKESLPPTEGSQSTADGHEALYNTKDSLLATNGYGTLLSYNVQDSSKVSFVQKSLPSQTTQAASSKLEKNYGGLVSHFTNEDKFFFLENSLTKGTKMNLQLKKGKLKSHFLPRQASDNIPFSSGKLEEIINLFSLDPKSQKAYILAHRINLCEEPTIKGVEKLCVTSLESMVDYVTSKIGKNVKAIALKLEQERGATDYTITQVKKLTNANRQTVVCHKMDYPYAIFFCHITNTIRSYMVSLQAEDGSVTKAVATCHAETNAFLENYALNVLKVKPGSVHICHFPPVEDSLIWVSK